MNTARGVACRAVAETLPPMSGPPSPPWRTPTSISSPGGARHERLDSLGAGAGAAAAGRLTWLAAALTVLSPLAGLTVYRSASADTMQSLMWPIPPGWGVLGGLLLPCLTSLRPRPYLPAAGWRRSATRGGVPLTAASWQG